MYSLRDLLLLKTSAQSALQQSRKTEHSISKMMVGAFSTNPASFKNVSLHDKIF